MSETDIFYLGFLAGLSFACGFILIGTTILFSLSDRKEQREWKERQERRRKLYAS